MSKNELIAELAEIEELETKSKAFDSIIITLENALCYMEEQGEDDNFIKKYLGIDDNYLKAIREENYESLAKSA